MEVMIFLALNLADAWLTKMALALGAIEVNPIASFLGTSIMLRIVLVIVTLAVLYWFGKERLLWGINLLFLGVVLWNLTAIGLLKVGVA